MQSGSKMSERRTVDVLGTPIDLIDWDTAINKVSGWAERRESRYVCICNVHSVVTAERDLKFKQVLAESDLNTPDGAPIAWYLRKLGHYSQKRINGPDFMEYYMHHAAKTGEKVYFYGSTQETLNKLIKRMKIAVPNLSVSGCYSPPFRSLSQDEDEAIIHAINTSGATTVWVSLGCPKQERWMAEHRGRVKAVMLGVGAAFDYHAGSLPRAPKWMRDRGLEWFYRLTQEPRRLVVRYSTTNSAFIKFVLLQMLKREI